MHDHLWECAQAGEAHNDIIAITKKWGFGHLILDDIFHSLFNLFLANPQVIGICEARPTRQDDENAEATGVVDFHSGISRVLHG